LEQQALHDAAAALAAKFTLRSKRMNPFVRRDRAAAATKKGRNAFVRRDGAAAARKK